MAMRHTAVAVSPYPDDNLASQLGVILMAEILDIAHLAFLELIRDTITTTGGAAAKGMLMRKATAMAEAIPEVEYASLDEWAAAVKDASNPITRIEGVAIRDGNIFCLPACPFAPSIRTYTSVFEKLPSEYSQLVEEFNKPSAATYDLRVGHGAGVSPFCAIHQPLRSAIAKRIKVGGKRVQVVQLGCRSSSGDKGFADAMIEELGVTREKVDAYLDQNMCVYGVRVEA
jgi:hypothetical protein